MKLLEMMKMESLCDAYEEIPIKNIRDFLAVIVEEIELEKDVNVLTDRQIMTILKKIAPKKCELIQEGKILVYRRIENAKHNGVCK
jgi:hypothetical protein